jgi:hypothetical protein
MKNEKIILKMNIINKDGPRISSHDNFSVGIKSDFFNMILKEPPKELVVQANPP